MHGCGVTARNFDDALELLKTRVFRHRSVPVIESIVTAVDISTLDADLVLSQMWAPVWRGVWFPLGFQDNMTPEEEQEIAEEKEKEELS